MESDLTKVKDIIYVILTPLQFLLTLVSVLVIGCLWEKRKRKKDRREAREKADTEKIAAVLGKQYDEVEKILHNFKKNVEKLANNIIITDEEGKNTTEFDVLLYMCHPENMERFDNTDQHGLHGTSSHVMLGTATDDVNYATIPRRGSGYGIKEVKSDVNKIMKLFIEFRIQLSSIHDKACPEDIKSEFSTKIIDMGKTIFPFVSTPRQNVIKKVLKYFGFPDTTPGTQDAGAVPDTTTTPTCLSCCFPCCPTQNIFRCCVRQNAHGPETQNPLPTATPEPNEPNAGNESTELLIGPSNVDTQQSSVPGPSSTNQEANQGQTLTGLSSTNQRQTSNYPGDNTIKCAIPYINYFRYNKGEMSCNVECRYSCFKNLQSCVERRITGVIEKENEIRDAIKKIWPAQPSEPADQLPEGDLLHLIRMVMFKMLDNSRSKFFNEERLKEFVEYVKSIVNSPENLDRKVVIMACKRELGYINNLINDLRRDNFKPLLEDVTTPDILHDHAEGLRMFVMEMIKKHNIGIDTMT